MRKLYSENRAFGHLEFQPFRELIAKEKVSLNAFDRDSIDIDSQSDRESLFDKIFSVDPVTGLPCGDVAVFMSQNTSPEVKMFIQSQLMTDFSSVSENKNYDGISDDDIAAFGRGKDESLSSYRHRIVDFVKSQQSSND